MQTLNEQLQNISVLVFGTQVPKHVGDVYLTSALIKTVHLTGVINGVR
jgi:hypothetical protein